MKPIVLTALFLALAIQAHASPRLDIHALERAAGLPPGIMTAVWKRECSMRIICPRGKHKEWGRFQIKEIRARDAGCLPGWRGEGSALCAARILSQELKYCGSVPGALTRYNRPANGCRPSHYGTEVYRTLLNMWMQESRNREIKLAMK